MSPEKTESAPPPAPAVESMPADIEGSGAAILDDLGDEALRIDLDKFEGPFEVLLYLIRMQEVDIFDIPILKITEQYLQLLDLMRDSNLDIAGEFLVMAATLIQIKSRMILPVEIEEEEEELEEEDPRLELVEKLLEYRKFRDLSLALGRQEAEAESWFGRAVKPTFEAAAEEEDYFEVSLYDLIKAIRSVLRFVVAPLIHQVQGEGASVDEKIALIEETLEKKESMTWGELYKLCKTRPEVICCLLAILELCRMRRVRVHQHHTFGDIRIFARAPELDAPLDVALE